MLYLPPPGPKAWPTSVLFSKNPEWAGDKGSDVAEINGFVWLDGKVLDPSVVDEEKWGIEEVEKENGD